LADLAALQKVLGVSFNDPSLLEQSLVHSSYLNENPGFAQASNERLEFLGDAMLGEIVAEKLYRDSPHLGEGEMSRMRASLVRGDTLARIAGDLRLGDYLYVGKGEDASGGRHKPANLAGALEAVIAAIFLDRGSAAAGDFILRLFREELRKIASQDGGADCKSRLQELFQTRQQPIPVYHVVSATGPAHDKSFTVEVRIGNDTLGRGVGKSKKAAETEAARNALKQISTDFTQ
jgi:ribonuclease-3